MDSIIFDSIVFATAGDVLASVGNALSVVLGLGAVIFFHELGHFAVAKWCNVHVERFSIGIGPIIWSRQKGETEYALSMLPFGGYVKMLGQDDMDPNQMTSDEIAENPRSYSAKKVWQRMAIISAGVIMNVMTGFLFFATAYWFGVVEQVQMIGQVQPGSPAWVVGIRPGDTVDKIDGVEINKFSEINQSVVLSSSSLRIEGKRADETPFDVVVNPKMDGATRRIGCGSTLTSTLSTMIPDGKPISLKGFASEAATERFLPGDKIVAMNEEPVEYFHEIGYLTAKYAAEPITYTINRPATEDGEDASTVMIEVPSKKARSLGLWMAIGRVSVIAENSIAAKAGLQIKDQIIRVDDKEVGKDLDPLTIPNYFAQRAGEEIKVEVDRPMTGDKPQTVVLTIVPSDRAGWSETPSVWNGKDEKVTKDITIPLTIPAIGAGFHVQPRIAHIVEGSEAEKSGKFKIGQKIATVHLEHANPKKIEADLLGDNEVATIDLQSVEGEPNWAWVFHLIQSAPSRQVRIHVDGSESEGSESFGYLLKEHETCDDLYMASRGIIGFEFLTRIRYADGVPDAAALGFRETRSSGVNIYLTLQSLFQGNLSVKALSGPLGIVRIGYAVADSGTTRLLMFLGFLSINLAVLNFLPIPILDGGHMVFLIWEAVARRKPSTKVINAAHSVGLIFIISLFVFVLYLDIFVNV